MCSFGKFNHNNKDTTMQHQISDKKVKKIQIEKLNKSMFTETKYSYGNVQYEQILTNAKWLQDAPPASRSSKIMICGFPR